MKKTLLITALAFFSHISNGQKKEIVTQQTSEDSIIILNDLQTPEQRLSNQEQEVENLKKENQAIKKQLRQIKNTSVIRGSGKTVINRKGSKQLVIE